MLSYDCLTFISKTPQLSLDTEESEQAWTTNMRNKTPEAYAVSILIASYLGGSHGHREMPNVSLDSELGLSAKQLESPKSTDSRLVCSFHDFAPPAVPPTPKIRNKSVDVSTLFSEAQKKRIKELAAELPATAMHNPASEQETSEESIEREVRFEAKFWSRFGDTL